MSFFFTFQNKAAIVFIGFVWDSALDCDLISFSLVFGYLMCAISEADAHVLSRPSGLSWSYDFSWSSPPMHPQQQNHTTCSQANVLTADKHSSDCGGNSFFFFFFSPKLQCAPFVSEGGRYIDQEGMHAKPASSEGPLLAAAPLEGTASVWLGTECSLLGDTPAADNGGKI